MAEFILKKQYQKSSFLSFQDKNKQKVYISICLSIDVK